MKWLLTLGIVLMAIGCSPQHKDNDTSGHTQHAADHEHQHSGHEHQHGKKAGSQLMVTTDPNDPVAGSPVMLKLMIHQADGTMVKDFEVVHDEKVHLVIVRDGLDHFAHVHPMVDARGNLSITHTFPVGGKYRLFADYSPRGGEQATAFGALSVGGKSKPAPDITPNAPGDVDADGLLATISASPLKSGSPSRVKFSLKDKGGQPANLQKYMAELGHLMFVGVDSGEYVHVHPLGGVAGQGSVEFEAHFANPGLYKGWGQFKHDGRVRVIPFVVKVE
jgi:hypothetical protein